MDSWVLGQGKKNVSLIIYNVEQLSIWFQQDILYSMHHYIEELTIFLRKVTVLFRERQTAWSNILVPCLYSHARNLQSTVSLANDNQSLYQIIRHKIALSKYFKNAEFLRDCDTEFLRETADPHINNNAESTVNLNSASFTQTEDFKKPTVDSRTLRTFSLEKKSPW